MLLNWFNLDRVTIERCVREREEKNRFEQRFQRFNRCLESSGLSSRELNKRMVNPKEQTMTSISSSSSSTATTASSALAATHVATGGGGAAAAMNNSATTTTAAAAQATAGNENEKQMVGGCCVCADDSGYGDNLLVYCDGEDCEVAVHQGCYGISNVPEGNWYCRRCEFKLNNPSTTSKAEANKLVIVALFIFSPHRVIWSLCFLFQSINQSINKSITFTF